MSKVVSYFNSDNFAALRSATDSAGVAYDPDSLLTEGEVQQGLGYYDPRQYASQLDYDLMVRGDVESEAIVQIAPRVQKDWHPGEGSPSPISEESGYVDSVKAHIDGLAWYKTPNQLREIGLTLQGL